MNYTKRRKSTRKHELPCIIKNCINSDGNTTEEPATVYNITLTCNSKGDNRRLMIWIQTIIKQNGFHSTWKPNRRSAICSLHFVGGQMSEDPLHPAYHPTLFTNTAELDQVKNIKQESVDDVDEKEGPSTTQMSIVEDDAKNHSKSFLNITEVDRVKKIKQELDDNVGEREGSSTTQNSTVKDNAKNHSKSFLNITEVDRVKKIKQQFDDDWDESEMPLTLEIITVEGEPKKKRKKKIPGRKPTLVVVRKNFLEEPMERESSANDVECQVEFDESELTSDKTLVNCMICNVKTENGLNCVETQVNLKKRECDSCELTNTFYVPKCTLSGIVWTHKIQFNGISSIRSNNNLMDTCGLNFRQFKIVLSSVPEVLRNSTVNNANKLLITLMKLRQGLNYNALAIYFSMQQSLVRELFDQTLTFLIEFAEARLAWIKKEVIRKYIPESFKPEYSNCRAMVDCIEIQIELPESAEAQIEYYKNYKDCPTFKVFIACAPNGFVMYKSKCYNGRKDNGLLAQDSEFLNLIELDDVILCDKEFPGLEVALESRGATLKKVDMTVGSDISPAYLHLRETLNHLRHFKIFSSMPMDQLYQIDNIVQICCSLINLHFFMTVPKYCK